jgi:hypothetical protein
MLVGFAFSAWPTDCVLVVLARWFLAEAAGLEVGEGLFAARTQMDKQAQASAVWKILT